MGLSFRLRSGAETGTDGGGTGPESGIGGGAARAGAPGGPRRDPLEPIEAAVTVVCVLGAVLLTLWAALAIFAGVGFYLPDRVCVADPSTSGGGTATAGMFGASSMVDVEVRPTFCFDGNPGQRALYIVATQASLLWHAGALVMAWLLIRRARKYGPFTRRTVRGLTVLGWYLAAGAVALHLVQGLVHGTLISYATDYWGYARLLDLTQVSWWPVFIGLGLLTFARLIQLATDMREDLEGLV
ncbi:DUF2975 domain-containing protein [Streptomyces carpaticus]|uniref:DUF2975 domain-containing protein n=1 Tax=Streptomyces carpaticus TaxID=285558 RepID=A0ABV4ZGB8_9ACTN